MATVTSTFKIVENLDGEVVVRDVDTGLTAFVQGGEHLDEGVEKTMTLESQNELNTIWEITSEA